ncbi:MAG TPA: hypothetical protein VN843_00565 [Anaerolineales bacterium]|nr:hypothetical protein [Anaerolineales bacterium]
MEEQQVELKEPGTTGLIPYGKPANYGTAEWATQELSKLYTYWYWDKKGGYFQHGNGAGKLCDIRRGCSCGHLPVAQHTCVYGEAHRKEIYETRMSMISRGL